MRCNIDPGQGSTARNLGLGNGDCVNELASELYGGKIWRGSVEYCADHSLSDTSYDCADHTALGHLDFRDSIVGLLRIPHLVPQCGETL